MCFTYSRGNVPNVLTCLACLHAHVPTSLASLRAHVSTCLACLRANLPCVLTCSRTNVPCVLCMSTCSHAITTNNKEKFSWTCFPYIFVIVLCLFPVKKYCCTFLHFSYQSEAFNECYGILCTINEP